MSIERSYEAGRNLSHGHAGQPFRQTLAEKRAQIEERGNLDHATIAEQLDILNQLAEFPFGRFLLQNQGWNGFWTDFVMEHPAHGRKSGTAPDGRVLTDLELRLLDTFPMVLATQERSRHFAAAIQDHIVDGNILASVPCGLMRDLLGRDFSAVSDIRLVGIDIDEESLSKARRLAAGYNLPASVTFHKGDAWELGYRGTFDLIASNGLNTYEPDDERVTELYRGFFSALKPGGILVTSFLTPPPEASPASEWNINAIDPEALRLQRIVFADIVGVSFQCYRNSSTTRRQLREAGFLAADVVWDRARIYPAVIAGKPA
ncbi:class I SAM-dependent methyltransferase [Hoeflea sp. TYP-13]|uniref:class I SAM-dependent methyltransferase n=1 Tax=Hoeflea sp. TYP-13 TaxID=3230023 RepID=UPI0034C5E8F6